MIVLPSVGVVVVVVVAVLVVVPAWKYLVKIENISLIKQALTAR